MLSKKHRKKEAILPTKSDVGKGTLISCATITRYTQNYRQFSLSVVFYIYSLLYMM